MTATPDLGKLTRDAQAAQAALSAAKAEQAAVAKADADERQAREVDAAWWTIATYRQRQAEAESQVDPALAAFEAAVLEDLALAGRRYIAVVEAMAHCNALGEAVTLARSVLRLAGELPQINRPWLDPIGDAAPHPLEHGLVRLPSFLEMVDSTLDKQRKVASRSVPVAVALPSKVTEAMKLDVRRAEWVLVEALELVIALRVQWPDRFAKLPPEEQADALAYLATREAAGFDDPLPKVVTESSGAPRSETAREQAQGWSLNR